MSTFTAFEEQAMRRALELAGRGLETADPNPRVGCVIVRDGQVVGEGWHVRAGEAHAEIGALREAGERAAGATAFVTLEPCCHHGRTPPCTEALIEARLARVVFAVRDPNPRVDGGGAARLAAAGIDVAGGLLESQAAALNAGFLLRMRAGRPWVRLKTAASLDGRTALANGASRWITGEAARAVVHDWRARSSAVATGIGTLLADDPRLDVRRPRPLGRAPARVVFDTRLRTPPAARVFDAPGEVFVLHAAGKAAEQDAGARLATRGARLEAVAAAGTHLDLAAALRRLGELGMNELWVEAGATLAGALLGSGLVDEWLHYLAPKLLGPAARPLADLPRIERLGDARGYSLIETTAFGADLRLRLVPGKV
ncbi:MAG: bifunctional diaminohydroxyphosphoribosylaminopyrimidine deaminase/5-amino-6-(5-phosphoribosylamino)uracil reductase RibD [Steroidobacteraceae bacterium]